MTTKIEEITEIIRKHQLKYHDRKHKTQDAKDNAVHLKAEAIARILGGEDEEKDPSMPLEYYVLKSLYYHMLMDYTGNWFLFEKEPNAHSIAMWRRVEAARQDSGVDAQTFLKAQFDYFDEHFKTHPKLMQLTTEAAIERAIDFTGNKDKRVIGTRKVGLKRTDVFKETEKQIQTVMREHKCSRVEFYQKFVLTGLLIIPKEFIQLDPAYKQAKGTND